MTTEKEEIPCCENCPGPCPIWIGSFFADRIERDPEYVRFTSLVGCLSHPGARAYLNKDVIKTLESWINGLEYPDCPPGDSYARVIALLRGDNK